MCTLLVTRFFVKPHLYFAYKSLYATDVSKFADLVAYAGPKRDQESGLMYADAELGNNIYMQKLDNISRPLVTAVENDIIFFISHKDKMPLSRLEEHLNL